MSEEQNTENQETEASGAVETATGAENAASGNDQAATGADAGAQETNQNDDSQQANGQTAEDQDDSEQQQDGAPEQYEDFSAPEGTAFDPETISEFGDVARDLDLSQDQAQSVLDRMAPVMHQRQQAQLQAISEQWQTEALADTEIGGDGHDEYMAVANKGFDGLDSEFQKLLKDSGFGNNKHMIKLLHERGEALSEDDIITGGSGNSGQRKSFYPNSNMN